MRLLVSAEEGAVDEKCYSEAQLWCIDNEFELVVWERSAPPTSAASTTVEEHTDGV